MKIKLLVASLAVIGAAGANAGTVNLDPFTQFQEVTNLTTGLSSTSTNSGGGVWSSRTLSLSGLTGTTAGSVNPNMNVNAGVLSLGSLNEAGTGTISWNLPSSVVGLFSSFATWSISLEAVRVDDGFNGGGTSVAGSLRTASNTPTGTKIIIADQASGITNPFAISFQFATGADSSWKLLNLDYTCKEGLVDNRAGGCAPSQVPAPATLAILGLGLLGLAGMRRKA